MNKYSILHNNISPNYTVEVYNKKSPGNFNLTNLKGDSGIDLEFQEDFIIPGNAKGVLVDLNYIIKVKKQYWISEKFVSFLLLPRSSIFKTPVRMSNSIGLIDSGYYGTLKVPLDNLSSDNFVILKGTRLFQVVLPNLDTKFNIYNRLLNFKVNSSRGTGGFGSTK